MRRKLSLRGNVALTNTGPLDDPLVRGIDLGGQFGIGQYPLRQIGAAAEHDRTYRSQEIASCTAGAESRVWPWRLSVWLILVRRS